MGAARTGAAIYHSDEYIYMIGGLGVIEKNTKMAAALKSPGYLKTSELCANQTVMETLSSWKPGPRPKYRNVVIFAVAQHKKLSLCRWWWAVA